MRILELYLKAFGPFTEAHLDLSRGNQGLHLVFGNNEAGKSSALRALKALLFGIGERTSDAFLHPYNKLRIGGRLRLTSGEELAFMRCKGRKGTLLSWDEEAPLDDQAVAPYVAGLDAASFELLFALDHERLVSGGRALLDQEGEVGQALFSAASGTRELAEVIRSLDGEADELFVPRGQKQRVNELCRRHAELQTKIKDATLSSREWRERDQELRQTTEELERMEQALAENRSAGTILERKRRILPLVAELAAAQAELAALGPAVDLPGNFTQLRMEAQRDYDQADLTASGLEESAAKLVADFQALGPRDAILDRQEEAEKLIEDRAAVGKSLKDRSLQEGKRTQLRNDARELAAQIRADLTIERTAELCPEVVRCERRLVQLTANHEARVQAASTAAAAFDETELELDACRKRLQTLPAAAEVAALRKALAEAKKDGDLDRLLAEAHREVASAEKKARTQASALGLWTGGLEALPSLPLPPVDSIRRMESERAAIALEEKRLSDDLADGTERLAETKKQLVEVELGGSVPTEKDLFDSRRTRDDLWVAIRDTCLSIGSPDATVLSPPGHCSPDKYEESVVAADEVSDRLRREAERVQRYARLRADEDALRQNSERQRSDLDRCAGHRTDWERRWLALWGPCGIAPLAPEEMIGWLAKADKLLLAWGVLEEKRRREEDLARTMELHAGRLAALLDGSGEKAHPDGGASAGGLATLLHAADLAVAQSEATANERSRLHAEEQQLVSRQAREKDSREREKSALEKWQADWALVMGQLGLPHDTAPSDAAEVMRLFKEFQGLMKEVGSLDRRLFGIDQTAEDFSERLLAFLRLSAPELAAGTNEDKAVAGLKARLTGARKAETRQQQLREQLDAVQAARAANKQSLDLARRSLARLLEQAGCSQASELPDVERRSARKAALLAEVQNARSRLIHAGEGVPIQQLLVEAEGGVPELLDTELARLNAQVEGLEGELRIKREQKGSQESTLRALGDESKAAQLEAESQEVLAELREEAERYMRLRIAHRLLKGLVDRYQEENQDPVLRRGGDIFSALTCGRFVRLAANHTGDRPVLQARRENGECLGVEAMSDGTRDQLYLALRIAALERHVAGLEPPPFIVDDVLVNFDDQRCRATLDVLADLSARTQVILFSHQSRLVELAESMGRPETVFVHQLR